MRPSQLFNDIYDSFPGILYSGLIVDDELAHARLKTDLDADEHESLIMRLYFIANDPEKNISYFITQYAGGRYLYFSKIDNNTWLFLLSNNKAFAKLHFYVKFLMSESAIETTEEQSLTIERQQSEQLNSAKRIQEMLFPKLTDTLSEFSSYELWYEAADTIGGDFYWSRKEKEVTWVAIGDCTGHGVEGALASVSVMSILNQIYHRGINPHMLIKGLHQSLADMQTQKLTEGYGIGCEMIALRFDHRKNELTYSGTGLSLYLKTADGKMRHFRTRSATFEAERVIKYLRSRKLPITKGDQLITFSDGVKDQLSPKLRRLPRLAISQTLRTPDKWALSQLKKTIADYQQSEKQTDDRVALLVTC